MKTALPKLHRINAAAAALGVSRATIYRFVNQGKLTLVQLGKNSSAITEDSLRAMMALSVSTPATFERDFVQGSIADPLSHASAGGLSAPRRSRSPRENSEIERLSYLLTKHVADMEHGFTISTGYGSLRIDKKDAVPIARIVRSILLEQIERARKGRAGL